MSRIGRKPIPVPAGVEIKIDDNNVVFVKGPKGQLEKELHREMNIKLEDNNLLVERPSDAKDHRSLHGLTRTLLSNMVEGVTQGFQRNLELVGVGYRAAKQGDKLVLTVGYSHPVEIEAPAGVEIEVSGPTKIAVTGYDKQVVGQTAANIRAVRKPEPYKGKGIRYADEIIRRKAGKAGTKGKA